MKIKIVLTFIGFLAIIICVYYALSFYALSKSNIQELIIYSDKPEKFLYPPKLAKFYLFTFRGGKEDIECLENSSGLGFVMNDPSIPKQTILEYMEFFIKKGFDINSIGFDGLSAIHVAILDNKPEFVSFLISNGADINVKTGYRHVTDKEEKTEYYGLNAKEFVKYLSKNSDEDRSAIMDILLNNEE